MKYFIDTEFLEGTQKGIFRDSKPTIDLISIGIVAEDGREYYAISKDFNIKEAWNRYQVDVNMDYKPSVGNCKDGHYNPQFIKTYWLRDNVCRNLFNNETFKFYDSIDTYKEFKNLVKHFGKTNSQIAEEIKKFTHRSNSHLLSDGHRSYPEFYGYYADYDWVVFCWLFGKMIDLPKGFPMFCMDLKQMLEGILDTKASHTFGNDRVIPIPVIKENIRTWLETHPQYPAQVNEHNALEDAKWNKKYYEFLKSL